MGRAHPRANAHAVPLSPSAARPPATTSTTRSLSNWRASTASPSPSPRSPPRPPSSPTSAACLPTAPSTSSTWRTRPIPHPQRAQRATSPTPLETRHPRHRRRPRLHRHGHLLPGAVDPHRPGRGRRRLGRPRRRHDGEHRRPRVRAGRPARRAPLRAPDHHPLLRRAVRRRRARAPLPLGRPAPRLRGRRGGLRLALLPGHAHRPGRPRLLAVERRPGRLPVLQPPGDGLPDEDRQPRRRHLRRRVPARDRPLRVRPGRRLPAARPPRPGRRLRRRPRLPRLVGRGLRRPRGRRGLRPPADAPPQRALRGHRHDGRQHALGPRLDRRARVLARTRLHGQLPAGPGDRPPGRARDHLASADRHGGPSPGRPRKPRADWAPTAAASATSWTAR